MTTSDSTTTEPEPLQGPIQDLARVVINMATDPASAPTTPQVVVDVRAEAEPEVAVNPPFPPHPWRAHVVVTIVWAAGIAASTAIHAPTALLRGAVAVHIVGVVLALGPIVLMDWYALVWMAGLRRFHDVIRLTDAAHPVIWLGTGLLLASGAVLAPDLQRPLTWVKLAAVLFLLHNGVTVRELGRRLGRLRGRTSLSDIPTSLRWPMVSLFAVSQAGWWTATVIGFATSFGRHGP